MTDRERWIVYPLLFLALGASLRDKLVDRTTKKIIACQELLILDEQPPGGEPVLLARLGGIPRRKAEDPFIGQFVLNGNIEVFDRDPTQQSAHRLVSIGRAQFGPKGPVGGHIGVNGQLIVNGGINATFYAYQGQPIVPALRGVFPGASIPSELLRALPQAMNPQQQDAPSESAPAEDAAPGEPPTDGPGEKAPPAQPSATAPQSPADVPAASPTAE
jgi:hypothetical protein